MSVDDQLAGALRERGYRVTPQRLLIHRALRELDTHASAEEVLARVEERLPGTSLPTVYATLDLLSQLGIARRIDAGPGPGLYDPHTDDHGHLACRVCGRIEDVPAKIDASSAIRAARRRGLRPERAELVLSGLCADCASG